jgi:hypothetical protein
MLLFWEWSSSGGGGGVRLVLHSGWVGVVLVVHVVVGGGILRLGVGGGGGGGSGGVKIHVHGEMENGKTKKTSAQFFSTFSFILLNYDAGDREALYEKQS